MVSQKSPVLRQLRRPESQILYPGKKRLLVTLAGRRHCAEHVLVERTFEPIDGFGVPGLIAFLSVGRGGHGQQAGERQAEEGKRLSYSSRRYSHDAPPCDGFLC